ncbi:hypothetical protein MPER_15104, partial [Moniliophthora perniciosa FA553]
MEAVLERQRQARKEKRQRKEKERGLATRASQSSPTPAGASGRGSGTEPPLVKREDQSNDADVEQVSSMTGSEVSRRVNICGVQVVMNPKQPPPLTPSQAKYYREHTINQGLT